jgi:hypothetical protein
MERVAMRQAVVVGLIVSTVGAGTSSADGPSPVTASPRVRVTAPAISGKRLVGTLLAMDETTMTIGSEKGKRVLEVPRAAVTRIEVSRRSSRKGKGAGIGALVGLGAAVAIGFAAGEDCPPRDPNDHSLAGALSRICFGRNEMAVGAGVLTIPLGALIGLAAAPGERWARTTPDRLKVAVTPVRGSGVGAALSVRF